MIKLLTILALTFYFFALLFGLMLYLGRNQKEEFMTAGEVIGYATITKPEAKEIQRLMDEQHQLSMQVEQLQSELIDKQTRVEEMKTQAAQLQKEMDTLTGEKQQYQKGQTLATDLLAMKPQQAAATLAAADDALLRFFVSYAMPFMRGDAQYKKMMDAVAKNNPALAAKLETFVAAGEDGMPPADVSGPQVTATEEKTPTTNQKEKAPTLAAKGETKTK